MQEIATTAQTLPEKLRKEHKPKTGDIYFESSSRYERFFRLGERKVTESDGKMYVHFEREVWSFVENKWKPDPYGSVSEESLMKEGYRRCLVPFGEVIAESDRFFRGGVAGEEKEAPATEELVALGSRLPDILSQTEMLEDRMTTLAVAYKARMEEERQLMEKRMEPLKALIKQTKKQLLNIHRAISIVEIYQGENVEVVSLCEGTPAGADVPVAIRQRILFMDEECAVLDTEGQGLDYWTRDRFYEWIKDPRHRDVILPEQKCVVVMKPRRYDKRYSSDYYEQKLRNEWNRHSFIFIRNGENVSVIESDDLCIYDAVVPRKADFDSIAKEAKTWRDDAEAKLEDINYRCIHFAMVLQGINDHSDIFSPHAEINFLKNIGTQVVFDDEADTLLGTGRPDFPDWLSEQAKTIRRGSRIIYAAGFADGNPYRDDFNGYRYNHPGYHGPKPPKTGLYTVEDKGSAGLGFSYLPEDEIWSLEKGWHKRERRETWIFWKEKVINYDTVSADDLKAYLEDRSQRRYYQGIIPLLRKYQLELEKEQEYENLFLSALTKVLDEKNIGHTPESLQNALKWWKTKVIHVRPVSSDDDKAWRMIIGHVRKH